MFSVRIPILVLATCLSAFPQNPDSANVAPADGRIKELQDEYASLAKKVDALGEVKLSGYIQVQAQHLITDSDRTVASAPVASFAGGDFGPGISDRLMVRRAYLKATYKTGISQYVVNLEATEGSLAVKDLYVAIADPWMNAVTLTAGLFDVPFGFEVPFSSASRESPERARVIQTLIPGEKDMGVQLGFAYKQGALRFVNAKVGVFSGAGMAKENDNGKNLAGRLGFEAPFGASGWKLSGGASGYLGTVTSLNDTASGGMSGTAFSKTTGNLNGDFDRQYADVDLQLAGTLPVLGAMALRGEFAAGQQPGTSASSRFYTAGQVFERDFQGWYVNYVQDLASPIKLILKYDVYDPNTDVEGRQVGAAGSGTNATDAMFSTMGGGFLWDAGKNLRFTLYYDYPINEEIASGPLAQDLDDQVLTARLQYKY
jgi:phosphate-selective porin